jgi:hypothetical protein
VATPGLGIGYSCSCLAGYVWDSLGGVCKGELGFEVRGAKICPNTLRHSIHRGGTRGGVRLQLF